uniref:Axonemal dynein light chain domain containing 1 n=1 Tax=Neogobius melanostomus TaxID=47308 RepID=A0A8C6SMC3_9GOBI
NYIAIAICDAIWPTPIMQGKKVYISVYSTYQRPDAVWHHPLGRKKYKHFLEQPTSLTGAGRSEADNSTPVFACSSHVCRFFLGAPLSSTTKTCIIGPCYNCSAKVPCPRRKPSGRQEVLQLMRVMDDMLEKAGVQPQEELNQLSQVKGLLDLVRTEQNIYNVVFHELIRQVSVGCAERGQLLAKLRQRYQSLLERIPRYLKALHTEAVAQRALDRQLTVEIHRIKTSIQQLITVYVQMPLCFRVVQRYHELYELQRSRLNSQMHQMAEERDLWSQFTYCLALKVGRMCSCHSKAGQHQALGPNPALDYTPSVPKMILINQSINQSNFINYFSYRNVSQSGSQKTAQSVFSGSVMEGRFGCGQTVISNENLSLTWIPVCFS